MMWAARPARPRCTAHGHYVAHKLLTSFCAVFPIDNPRYLVFVLLDEPHGTKETGGHGAGRLYRRARWRAA